MRPMLATMLLVVVQGPAMAEEPVTPVTHRRWSIGLDRPLGVPTGFAVGDTGIPLPGLAATFRFADRVGAELIAGVGYSTTSREMPVGERSSSTAVSVAARLLWWPLTADRFRLGLVAGVGYRGEFGGIDAGGRTGSLELQRIAAELGVRPEWFLSDRLSVHTTFGGAFFWSHENTGDTTLGGFAAGDVVAHLGLSVWF